MAQIPWDDFRYAFPASITIIFMPLTYSIAYGLIFGIAMAMVVGVVEIVFGLFGFTVAGKELGPQASQVRSFVYRENGEANGSARDGAMPTSKTAENVEAPTV